MSYVTIILSEIIFLYFPQSLQIIFCAVHYDNLSWLSNISKLVVALLHILFTATTDYYHHHHRRRRHSQQRRRLHHKHNHNHGCFICYAIIFICKFNFRFTFFLSLHYIIFNCILRFNLLKSTGYYTYHKV